MHLHIGFDIYWLIVICIVYFSLFFMTFYIFQHQHKFYSSAPQICLSSRSKIIFEIFRLAISRKFIGRFLVWLSILWKNIERASRSCEDGFTSDSDPDCRKMCSIFVIELSAVIPSPLSIDASAINSLPFTSSIVVVLSSFVWCAWMVNLLHLLLFH